MKDHDPRLEHILPPDAIADVGTILSAGLPDEAVARNIEAILHSHERCIQARGYSSGVLAQEIIKGRKKAL
jgi:hypothetical protein